MHWSGLFTIAVCASTAAAHQPVPRVGGNRKLQSELAAKKARLAVPGEHAEHHEKRQNTDDRCGEDYGACADGTMKPPLFYTAHSAQLTPIMD